MRLSDISSPPLRLELPISRWLQAALLVLMSLSACAVLLSTLPWAVVLLVPVLGWWALVSLRRTGGMILVFRADGSAGRLTDSDDAPIQPLRLAERGPLVLLAFVDGATVRRVACGPDILDLAARRALRLWFRRHVEQPRQVPGAAHA